MWFLTRAWFWLLRTLRTLPNHLFVCCIIEFSRMIVVTSTITFLDKLSSPFQCFYRVTREAPAKNGIIENSTLVFGLLGYFPPFRILIFDQWCIHFHYQEMSHSHINVRWQNSHKVTARVNKGFYFLASLATFHHFPSMTRLLFKIFHWLFVYP